MRHVLLCTSMLGVDSALLHSTNSGVLDIKTACICAWLLNTVHKNCAMTCLAQHVKALCKMLNRLRPAQRHPGTGQIPSRFGRNSLKPHDQKDVLSHASGSRQHIAPKVYHEQTDHCSHTVVGACRRAGSLTQLYAHSHTFVRCHTVCLRWEVPLAFRRVEPPFSKARLDKRNRHSFTVLSMIQCCCHCYSCVDRSTRLYCPFLDMCGCMREGEAST